MLAIHRIFQMIFGIIVSVTLLYFLLSYSGDYASVQRDKQRSEILLSFAEEVRSVYLTGISTNFTYLSKYNFSSCFVNATETIPEIVCLDSQISGIPIETPVIFRPGNQVYIARDTLDYGWWVFGFADAIPSTTFVFTPESTDGSWELMKNIVQHLPDTSDEWSTVKVNFAFCDGPQVLYVCGGKPCGKSDFLSVLGSGPSGTGFSPCTASMDMGMSLISISSSCGQYAGVCVNPPNSKGVGNAFVEGSGKTYVYKDPLDIVSLSVGGSEKDDFGATGAEKIYEYKNSVLMPRLLLAAEVMSRRASLVAGDVTEGCGPAYIELSQVLDNIPPSMDYSSVSDMYDLNDNLNQAKGIYQNLVELGCERVEYGA